MSTCTPSRPEASRRAMQLLPRAQRSEPHVASSPLQSEDAVARNMSHAKWTVARFPWRNPDRAARQA